MPEPQYRELQTPIHWDQGEVLMLDQRLLPAREVWNRYATADEVVEAIRGMVIRGAPAISCAAAMGLAAEACRLPRATETFYPAMERACGRMERARPTAVNLAWAVQRQRRVLARHRPAGVGAVRRALEAEALEIWREDRGFCQAMGRLGAELIPDGAAVLTHCNTGALATAGHGTALGVIRSAARAGKKIRVYADETRPFLQGARLTAWELMQDDIDVTVICDSAAGFLMQRGQIQCVVVGADRVAANGDVANKIGTYSVAVLARHHGVPFYVAAPRSTIDPAVATGAEIPIEERPPREVTHLGQAPSGDPGRRLVPRGCKVSNIAFDVTPRALVTALITEVGVASPPDGPSVARLLERTFVPPRPES